MSPTVDNHRKDSNVSRIYTWYTRSLCKRFGSPLLELLTAFKSNSLALIVVKPIRNLSLFVTLCTLCSNFFLTDVPFIFDLYLDGKYLGTCVLGTVGVKRSK